MKYKCLFGLQISKILLLSKFNVVKLFNDKFFKKSMC